MDQSLPNSSSKPTPPPNLDDLFATAKPKNSQKDPDLSGLEEKIEDISTQTKKADQKKIKQFQQSKQEEETITQFNDQLDQQNPQLSLSRHKERLQPTSSETIKYQERSTEFEPDSETPDLIKKSPGADINLPRPVKDDFGQIILEASRIPKPNITLPMTESEIEAGLKFHQKVTSSLAWLANWCKRTILLAPKRVFFPDTQPPPAK